MFTNYLIINDKLNICIKSNFSNIFNFIQNNIENITLVEHYTTNPLLTFFILENSDILNKCIRIKNKFKKSKFKDNFFIKIRNKNAIIVDKNKMHIYFFYDSFSTTKIECILKILISLINIIQSSEQEIYLKASAIAKNGNGILLFSDDNKYKEKILYLLLENGYDFIAKNLISLDNGYIKNKENIITIDLLNIFPILNQKLKQKIISSDFFKGYNNSLIKKTFLSKSNFTHFFNYKTENNVILNKIILLKFNNNSNNYTTTFLNESEFFNLLSQNSNNGSLNTFDFLECIKPNNKKLTVVTSLYNKVKSIQINYNDTEINKILDILLKNT